MSCPIYLVMFNEAAAPRFKAVIARKGELKGIFFLCTACSSCVISCPAKVSIDCFKRRAEMVKSGKEPQANRALRENIIRYGNPFGDVAKQKKIKQYYT